VSCCGRDQAPSVTRLQIVSTLTPGSFANQPRATICLVIHHRQPGNIFVLKASGQPATHFSSSSRHADGSVCQNLELPLAAEFSSSHRQQQPSSTTKKERKRPVRLPSNTHPDRAPKGKTSKDGVQIIARPLYSRRPKGNDRHLCRQIEGKKALTVWVPRIWIINPGGFCGSFREHKSGRLL
jgi:hypothetical protein